MSSQYQPKPMAQGIAKPATQAEIDKEATYTDPDLHRRIESDIQPETVVVDGREFTQTQPPEYSVGVFGVNSYRIIKSYYHDEESTESEIP